MNLTTFSITVAKRVADAAQQTLLGRAVDSVPPAAAHAIGIGSGLTGLALWAELAKHLTAIVGLLIAFAALAGGVFYAIYWAVKAAREWRAFRRHKR